MFERENKNEKNTTCSMVAIGPCHTAAILSRETKKALFYQAKPHPHGFYCEAWRGKTKLFWSPGTMWPPCDKGEFQKGGICTLCYCFGEELNLKDAGKNP